MKKILFFLFVIATVITTFADEGMWIPMLLGKNEADMQKQGMRITAKDIYDINNACLKDAVVLFGGGCTGEYVSKQGLLFTNHHCGYSQIAARSTLEHNYLANGFWAKSFSEEIPCPGLTVTRLVRMEDVTNQVLEGVDNDMDEKERNALINENIKKIGDKAVEGTHYKAVIKPFYYGNQYFMYINEVFSDVRLVGTPPSNIGKFGGDTDNWMWPRHTGDFSVFRVYADKDNKPAPYSADNQPYKPLKHLTISLKGAEQNDFTFVFGYPGTTQRYITSDAVELIANVTNPVRIALRTIRLDHYNNAMNQDAAQRLKYSSTVASIANGWKKWQGETIGVNRLEVPKMKREFEQKFQQWANDKPEYRDVLPQLAQNYATLKPLELKRTYFNEAVMASDFMKRAYAMWQLESILDNEEAKAHCEKLIKTNEKYFTDFEKHTIVDKAIFIETFTYMWQKGFAPYLDKKCHSKADVEKLLSNVYERSMLTHKDKVISFLKSYNSKKKSKIRKDPAVDLFNTAHSYTFGEESKLGELIDLNNHRDTYRTAQENISRLMRIYVKGMMEMQPDVNFFPDANLTLRVAYGHVDGFKPKDGVSYKPYTTIEGIMQKENPDIYDYVVEPRLKELYNNKDFGRYTNSKGELPVCFIATNHTTGGNSGSPVINADGQLIGLNFDRCWEGTMSDILFDPEYCRNITLDIRYCLFIIDKFAGAQNLINELDIVK